MRRRTFGLILLTLALRTSPLTADDRPPNIVLIMADDLGYGEVGCYGQTMIPTPNIDRLAAQGMRFTDAYAGSSVCAPSRSTLMTGQHTGHTPIRANGGGQAIRPEDVTVAEVLKQAGYTTGGFGKWGLGVEGSTGHPNRQGFDMYFGFLHQVHAHFHYPYWVWKNGERYPLPRNEGHQRNQYAPDEIQAQALDFIRQNQDRPFFCYIPTTLVHVELVVPEDSMRPFRGKWPEEPLPDPRPGYIGAEEPLATFAGMVSRLDRQVGEVLDLLDSLGIADETLVIFTSDNGPQNGAWKRMSDHFDGNGPLRGYKGQFYEGGIRVPLIARWPGRIAPGSETDHPVAFWDILPTLAEVAGAEPPDGIDGLSFLPTLRGEEQAKTHEYFYWEYNYPAGRVLAVRKGRWKAVRPRPNAPIELYDLKADLGESHNLADQRPEVLHEIDAILSRARTEARPFEPETDGPGVADYVR